jgi:hypothetical protein
VLPSEGASKVLPFIVAKTPVVLALPMPEASVTRKIAPPLATPETIRTAWLSLMYALTAGLGPTNANWIFPASRAVISLGPDVKSEVATLQLGPNAFWKRLLDETVPDPLKRPTSAWPWLMLSKYPMVTVLPAQLSPVPEVDEEVERMPEPELVFELELLLESDDVDIEFVVVADELLLDVVLVELLRTPEPMT